MADEEAEDVDFEEEEAAAGPPVGWKKKSSIKIDKFSTRFKKDKRDVTRHVLDHLYKRPIGLKKKKIKFFNLLKLADFQTPSFDGRSFGAFVNGSGTDRKDEDNQLKNVYSVYRTARLSGGPSGRNNLAVDQGAYDFVNRSDAVVARRSLPVPLLPEYYDSDIPADWNG